jgi:hypothetical protein
MRLLNCKNPIILPEPEIATALVKAFEKSMMEQFPGKRACCVMTMCKCFRNDYSNSFECNCHKENPHGV